MSKGLSDRTMRMAEMFRKGVPVVEIAAAFDVQRPAVWKALRRAGVLPPYRAKKEGGSGRPRGGGVPGYTRLRRNAAELRRDAGKFTIPVDRTPCFKCGVRGDIGCEHSKP